MTDPEFDANAQKIEELKAEIPALLMKRTGWARVRKLGQEVSLVVGLTALLLGVYVQREQSQTAVCVNQILADRSPLTASDSAAQLAALNAWDAYLASDGDPAARAAAETAIHNAARVLTADQAARLASPLGRC